MGTKDIIFVPVYDIVRYSPWHFHYKENIKWLILIYIYTYASFPFFSWFDRNGDQIGTSGNIYVQDNNLIFKNPAQIDTGNYTCKVSNLAYTKNQTVWIIVSGKWFLKCMAYLSITICFALLLHNYIES